MSVCLLLLYFAGCSKAKTQTVVICSCVLFKALFRRRSWDIVETWYFEFPAMENLLRCFFEVVLKEIRSKTTPKFSQVFYASALTLCPAVPEPEDVIAYQKEDVNVYSERICFIPGVDLLKVFEKIRMVGSDNRGFGNLFSPFGRSPLSQTETKTHRHRYELTITYTGLCIKRKL